LGEILAGIGQWYGHGGGHGGGHGCSVLVLTTTFERNEGQVGVECTIVLICAKNRIYHFPGGVITCK